MTRAIRFEPGYTPDTTKVAIDLPAEKVSALVSKLAPNYRSDYGYVAAEYSYGPRGQAATLVILPDENSVFIEVYNIPEGDERLDGGSPDYRGPRDTLWIDLIPSVRALFAGELPPYRLERSY